MEELGSALLWLSRALVARTLLKDEIGRASTRTSMGFVDFDRCNPEDANAPCQMALAFARDLRLRCIERNAHDRLYKAAKALGDDRSALVHFERFTALKDSLHAEDVPKGLERIEFSRNVMADSLRRRSEGPGGCGRARWSPEAVVHRWWYPRRGHRSVRLAQKEEGARSIGLSRSLARTPTFAADGKDAGTVRRGDHRMRRALREEGA